MGLRSHLFQGDPKLEACLISDPAHIQLGAVGHHVIKIQQALVRLGGGAIDIREVNRGRYGPSTAAAVLAYKRRKQIINWSYQSQADDIVGKMTIASLDDGLVEVEGREPQPFRPRLNWVIPVVNLELFDAAPTYRDIRGILNIQSGDMMVSASPGHLRYAICVHSESIAIRDNGKKFDPETWAVTSPKSRPPSPIGIQWCGIYATWLWSQVNMQTEWAFVERDEGRHNGPYRIGSHKRIMTSTEKPFIAPGDIIVENTKTKRRDPVTGKEKTIYLLHHLLVLRVSANGTRADVVEGNAGNGRASDNVVQIRSGYSLSSIGYFYSVDSYRWPHINYGTNYPGQK